jgi:hypothetical protein
MCDSAKVEERGPDFDDFTHMNETAHIESKRGESSDI